MNPSRNREIRADPSGIDRECIVVFLSLSEAFQCAGRFKLKSTPPLRKRWYRIFVVIFLSRRLSVALQYRIGEFSNRSGVSTKTLRFYDEIGLLRPASVDARPGYRPDRAQPPEDLGSILA